MPTDKEDQSAEVNFGLLLFGLLAILLAGPLSREYGAVQNPGLLGIVFGSSFLLLIASIAHRYRAFFAGLIPAGLTIILALLAIILESTRFNYLMLASAFLFCLAAIRYAAQEVFLSGAVDLNKITGSICIYLLLVLAWAIVYLLIDQSSPDAFSGVSGENLGHRLDQLVYFSLVTITTLGYGDVTPNHTVAGIAAGTEALAGVFYTTILVASLVGDFLARQK